MLPQTRMNRGVRTTIANTIAIPNYTSSTTTTITNAATVTIAKYTFVEQELLVAQTENT